MLKYVDGDRFYRRAMSEFWLKFYFYTLRRASKVCQNPEGNIEDPINIYIYNF